MELYENLFVATTGIVEEVGAGTSTPGRAAGRIMDLLREATFVPPMFEIGNPERRYTVDLDYSTHMKLLSWFRRSAPDEIRKLMFAR